MSDEAPEGWAPAPFSALADYVNGRAFKPEDWGTEGLPIIRIAQITDPEANTNFFAGNVDPRNLIDTDDLIFSWSATLAVMRWIKGPAVLNQHLFKVTPAEGIDRDWLQFRLEASIPELADEAHGTTMKHIRKGTLSSKSTVVPPLDEQRRIAEVLRSVDEALQAARQVTERCERVLRLELDSIAAKLLADGVPQVKLGDIAKIKGGKRLPKGSAYSGEATANPYIRVTDWRDYEIRTDEIRFISDDIAQCIWRYTISKSDLFISIAGSVGLVATVPDELDGAYLTENAAKISINNPEALDATFLVAVLRSRALAEQISKYKGVGGGVPKLALFRIEDLDIPLPDAVMQAEVAHSYQSVRASVEAARKAADQLERTRTEVMSDLLCGRVRVAA